MIPKETPDRKALLGNARRLLEWLSRFYIERVQSLAGYPFGHTPYGIVEGLFDSWRDGLQRAPAPLLEPKAVRLVIEEALAEAQLRCVARYQPSLGNERVTQLFRDFARAVHREHFANVAPKYLEWVDSVLPLPDAPPGAVTPDDARLRERVECMSEDKRRSLRELTLDETSTLRDLTPLAMLPGLERLHIRHAGMLCDLSPLSDLTELQELRIDGCPKVRDAGPLAHLVGLRVLRLEISRVRDLTPLCALRSLEELSMAASSALEDISPLAALASLGKLNLHDTGVRDLGALAGMEALRELSVSKCEDFREPSSLGRLRQLQVLDASSPSLQSLEGLRALRALVSLNIAFCPALTDIGGIGDFPLLEKLDLAGCPIPDLTPLEAASGLRELSLFGVRVRALPAMRALGRLEKLNLQCSDVESLAAIAHARSLRHLEIGSRTLRDFTPLATLAELEELDLTCEHMCDLEPLRALSKLRRLTVDGGHVRDLAPIANLQALTHVFLPRTKVESVEVLAGLPELQHVQLDQCDELTSLLPLAGCPHLVKVEADECDRLRGPKSLEELRASTRATAPKKFPSSAAPPPRGSALTVFDARNHLPKRPPERWSIPERSHGQHTFYSLEADRVRVCILLMSDDNDHLLVVYLAPMSDTCVTDKQAARILRRFRACDAFVETRYEDALFDLGPSVRCFIARAHAASPDAWGAIRQGHAPIRVESQPDDGEAAIAGAAVDVRGHLPSPLPEGWEVRRTKQPEDEACIVRAPEAEMTLWLRPAEGSDLLELVVGLFPASEDLLYIGDGAARALLGRLSAGGPFEENHASPFARAPGMRIFVAPAQRRSSAVGPA